MIIYGSRMYFKKNVVRSYGECEHCGRYGKNTSYQAKKFGHIYWIPLIPMGAASQVLRECKSCSMGSHIPTQQLEPMIDGLSDQFKSWIVAITEGKTELETDPDSPPTNIGVLIAGILEDLYCLKEIENVESITNVFDANNMHFERDLVLGRWHELQGDLDQSKLSYQAAVRAKPSEGATIYLLALVELKRNDLPAAEAAFQQYLQLHPEDVSAHIELLGAYEVKKDFPKIVETCDILFEKLPELMEQKKIKKLYKKSCKKSGLQGKFSTQI
jgi:hypothetical protein